MRHSILRTSLFIVLAAVCLSIQGPLVLADNISSANRILCAALQATRCSVNAQCESGSPRNWNIPDFIEIDLIVRRLETTEASGEKRIMPIASLFREDGHIFLQAIDKKRIFSIVINEQSGDLIAAMPSDRVALSVFAACTLLQ